MRLRRTRFRGLTRFAAAEPVTIDYDALGPGLVALVGPNGAGKTTALEAPFVSLYRRFATRPGRAYEHCHGADCYVESEWEHHGDLLRAVVKFDAAAKRPTTDAVLSVNGRRSDDQEDARLDTFDAAIRQRFGPAGMLLAGAFAAQTKAGSFLLLPRADRRDLFAELLGIGRLDRLAERARTRGAALRQRLDEVRAVIRAIDREIGDLDDTRANLRREEHERDVAQAGIGRARSELVRARERLETARSAQDRLADLRSREEYAMGTLQAANREADQAERMPLVLRDRYEREFEAINARGAEQIEPTARQAYDDTTLRLDRRQASIEAQLADLPDYDTAVADMEDAEREMADLDEQANRYAIAVRRLESMRRDLEEAERNLTRVIDEQSREHTRLRRQADLRSQVPCTAARLWTMEEAERQVSGLRDRISHEADRLQVEAEAEAARNARKVALQERVSGLRESVAASRTAPGLRHQLTEIEDERREAADALEARLAEAREAVATADAARTTARESLEAALDSADRHLQECRERRRQANGAHDEAYADLQAALANLGAVDLRDAERDARDREAALEHIERIHREMSDRVAGLRATLETLERRREERDDLAREADALNADLGDWLLIQDALGKTGLQAMLIGNAGPEVAALVNDLLESCYGARFSVTLETLRQKKSAAGEYAEVFDVVVYDYGQPRPVEALSGGERVIVGEAISLGIAVYNARKSGVRYETLWRDETASALDPDNAQAYVAMLRRAREIGGFHQVIYVAHLPEVWQAADTRLYVADGAVRAEATEAAA